MMILSGYKILSQIYASGTVSVYRGIWLEKNIPVILKVLTDEYPQQEDISRLKHEYNLIKDLNLPGAIRTYKLDKIEHRFALVLEDVPDSTRLSDFLSKQSISVDVFLPIALQLTRVLDALHSLHIIHKDINPNNIIITKDHQIKLVDFSIATQLSQETPEMMSPEGLAGTLAYMSPEQTARMNRVIDRRADLYSLGIIFYEMLTGILPFQAQDPLEWVYCHMAQKPKSPKEFNPLIPEAISNIVMKLLAKAPEDRYSTASGLAADIEIFIQKWQKKSEKITFPLGEKDHSGLFQIPQKLYGREREIEQLMEAFTKVSQGRSELLLVHGNSGVGKTSLINEVHKPVVRQRGYFAAGKFDQFQQNVPYFAMIQAFRKLIKQILTENKKNIEFWKAQLLRALSPNGQVIIEVIPEVEWLIGKQPSVPQLLISEAQSRFELVFFDFVQVFCQESHPVVIFLDDLQWADLASFALIKRLLHDGNLKYLLLIGAYRDNEMSAGHPLLDMIDDLNKHHVLIDSLQVRPLSFASIKQLVEDTLNTKVDTDPLAQFVFDKTGGNPFFCNAFLTMLHNEGHIIFDMLRAEWTWDMSVLHKLTITDNVLDLIVGKIEKFPEETRWLLKIAACIGNEFDLKTLAIVSESSLTDAARQLWPAMQENLVMPLSEGYRLIMADPDYAVGNQVILYKFSHDRIREALHVILTPEQNKLIHLKLGRLVLARLSPEELEEKVFAVVNNFNASLEMLTVEKERFEVAKLNIRAANKAKAFIAYHAAASYFEHAVKLLGEAGWQEHYPKTLEANIGYAENIHLLGKFSEADIQFAKLIKRTNNPLDKARILMFQVISFSVQSEWKKATDVALAGLEILGVKINRKPNLFNIIIELIKTKWLISRIKIENIMQLSIATDPEKILIHDFFERGTVAAYNINFKLVALLGLKSVIYGLKNGYSASAAISFAAYGILLIIGFGDYEQGIKLADLSLQMVEKFDDPRAKTRIYVTISSVLYPWKLPYRDFIGILNKAYSLGRQSGELVWAGYATVTLLQMMFIQGNELNDIASKLKNISAVPEFTGSQDALIVTRLVERLVSVLKDKQLYDSFAHEQIQAYLDRSIPVTVKSSYGAAGILCLIGVYLSEDWETALKIMRELEYYCKLPEVAAVFYLPEYFFFSSLVLLSIYKQASFMQRFRYRRHIKSSLRKLKKWAKNCPQNFEARYQLILGGWLQLLGQEDAAEVAFDRAIISARENNFTLVEAIANELIGRMYNTESLAKHAKLFVQEAASIYQRWGAVAKVQLLQQSYREFFSEQQIQVSRDTLVSQARSQHTDKSMATTKGGLDMVSIMKSVQTISGNVMLEDLLRSFISIVMENAGASRSLLLLEQNNQLVLVAKGESIGTSTEVQLLKNLPVDPNNDLCLPLVQYVQHTQEPVVLNNVAQEGSYTEDIYVINHKPLSVICLPIIHKGQMLGILYLENNLTAGAFTADHLDVLRLLAGQVAISLQNSQLFLAANRFVPHEFLDILGKHSIVDIHIGDSIQKNMTVLFADIRGFTNISEQLSPADSFKLMNEYLSYMEPIITKHGGFIDKFIGDVIMVLFPGDVDNALLAGIAMQEAVEEFNKILSERHVEPLRVGIGLNSGSLILGTLGGRSRMETSVISDAVNIASRIEELTKDYDSRLLISGTSYHAIKKLDLFQCRFIGKTQIRGRLHEVEIWEVYSADPEALRFAKMAISAHYERAVKLFFEGSYSPALHIFKNCLEKLPTDKVIMSYIVRCESAMTASD